MARSGIRVPDDLKAIFRTMEVSGKGKHTMLVEVCKEKGEFQLAREDTSLLEFDDLRELLVNEYSTRPVLVVFDYKKHSKGTMPKYSLIIILWCNDDKVGVKQKMLMASSLQTFKDSFPSCKESAECHDESDLDCLVKDFGMKPVDN